MDDVIFKDLLSSPVPVDDDLGRSGDVEVGRLLLLRFSERLLVERVCTVQVPPGQQQVLNL